MRYAVVIGKAETDCSAYPPDLPGCRATGATAAEVEREMGGAVRFHLDGLREDGLPVPEPASVVTHVDA